MEIWCVRVKKLLSQIWEYSLQSKKKFLWFDFIFKCWRKSDTYIISATISDRKTMITSIVLLLLGQWPYSFHLAISKCINYNSSQLIISVGSAVVVESDDGYKPKCVPGLDCDTKQIDKEGTTSPTANATNYVDENAGIDRCGLNMFISFVIWGFVLIFVTISELWPIAGNALEMRADKQRNETKPTATESDKEFDVYLEKYMSANPRALILRAQPNGQIENEITKWDFFLHFLEYFVCWRLITFWLDWK